MKILVANDLYGPSSAAGIAVAGARALAAMGHEVHFLATVQREDEASTSTEPSGLVVHQVFTPPYNPRWRAWKSLLNRPALRALREVLARTAPDIVHFHNIHIHLSYRALEVAAGRPVVLTIHDVMPFCFQKMFCFMGEHLRPDGPPISFRAPALRCVTCARLRYNPFRNAWIRHHVRRFVSRLLAVSPEMARALRENGFADVEVLVNGIDPHAAAAPGSGQVFREQHSLSGRKVVLYGGRLDHRKGAEQLLRAMVRVRERVPAAALLVVGASHGGYERRVLELAAELGLREHLAVTGWLDQDEMAAAYAAADVVCTPSLIYESFGLINAEGMLAGKPVVTSFFGGPRDVVEHGVSGFHVNPLHVDRLAEHLAHLLEADDVRREMGDAARRRVLEQFNLEIQTARLEAVYRQLLDGTGRA